MTNTSKIMVRTLFITASILLCVYVSNAQVLRGLNLMLVDTTGGTRDTTLVLPSTSATSYALTLPPNSGSPGALLFINSTTGNTSVSDWLQPGSEGEMLTVDSNGIPQWSNATTLPFWGLHGNMGTSPLTDFLGTGDAQPLIIRTDSLERMRILPTGEIGVGTSVVDANYLVDVHGAIIVGNQLDDVGNRQTGENAMLVAHKSTSTTQASLGLHTILSLDPTSANNQLGLGVYNNIDVASGNTQNFTGTVIASASQAAHLGSGTVSNMVGGYSSALNRSSGAVGNLVGFQGLSQNESTTGGTVGQLVGLAGQAKQFSGGGTANAAVSVWAQPASGGTTFNVSLMVGQQVSGGYLGGVTDVAFVVNDANRPSTINGALGVGTMPAANRLFHVNGTAGTANIRMASLAADGAAFAPATDGLVIADNNGDIRRTSVASVVASKAWAITGNAGINPLVNFIGTTDAQALIIKTDNTERLRITSAGAITQAGTGQVTFTGNVDAANGLDVTTANLTVGGTNFTVAPSTGNTSIAGTLAVTGATTMSSTLNQSGNAVLASTAGSSTTIGNATGAITLGGTALTPNVTVSNLGGIAKTSIGVGFDRIVLANNAGLLEEASIGTVLASTAWALTGNSGTSASNFLGTTDSVSLRLRTANTERLIIDSVGRVGVGTSAPEYTLDVAGMFSQTATLQNGRTTSLHSGDNVVGAGIEGVGLSSQATGGPLNYIFAGDATAAGGFANQSSIGITDLTSNNTQAIAIVDANGKYGFSIGRNDATTYAGTDWATDTVRTIVNNGVLGNTKLVVSSGKIMLNPYDGVNAHFFSVNPTNITSDKYPNARDNSGTETPINFLYTNASGEFQSAPLVAITNNSWSITGNAATTQSNFLGTTDSVSLRLRTSNTERLIIDSVGRVGINVSNPLLQLQVNGSFSASHQLINGAQAGIFSQDSIGSAAMSGTATEYIALSGTTARSFVGDRDYYGTQILEAGFEILDSVPGLYSEFKVRRGDPGVHQTTLAIADTIVGKNVTTQWDMESILNQVLDFSGSGIVTTLRLSVSDGILLQDSQGRYQIMDVPDGSITDSLLAIDASGYIHKLSSSDLVSTTAWSLTGNTGTSSTNFLGTTDSVSLRLRTANTERLIIDSVGRVGIGTSAPTNTLHVNASANPVRFEGVQTGDITDEILTADSTGVVKKQTMQDLNANLARKHNVKRVDADYVIADEDEYIICVGNADLDITIPDASASSGRVLTIVNMTQDAKDVFLVQAVGGAANIAYTGLFATPDTFDYMNRIGTVSFSTASLGGVIGNKVTMISDGVEWFVVGN